MGLGDIFEKITTYTGVKWIVKKLWGENCGCEERREAMNEIEIPFTINKKQH